MKTILTFLLILCSSQFVLAWGERGHHSVGYTAARVTDSWLTPQEKTRVGPAFIERNLQMGHLNNIPDISWKGVKNKTTTKLNGPTHYFDPEVLLGAKTEAETLKAYQNKITQLPIEWKDIEKQYKGKAHPFEDGKKVDPYFHSGSNPWRVQELYKKLVQLFHCAKENESKGKPSFRQPVFPLRGEALVKSTSCGKSIDRSEALLAAYVVAGVMGHFVADLAQPYHATLDYDGWATGQGGIHAYFETDLIHASDETLNEDVLQKALDKKFQKQVTEVVGGNWDAPVTAVMLQLAADSFGNIETLRKLDRQHAVVKLGDQLKLGESSKNREQAKRKEPTREVAKAFRKFAVERMAMGSVVLSRLWIRAWREAGSPRLEDVSRISTPYPLDVGFLVPDYAPGL